MARAIETRKVAKGSTLLLYKKTKGIYAKGLFQQEPCFTHREAEITLTQPSETVLQELINDHHHSEEALGYIRQAWREAGVKDSRFQL